MHLFTAPSLDQLAEILYTRQFDHSLASANNRSPLSPTTIVVQSRAMEQYLKWWLVRKQGIMANVEFPFPFHLISRLKELIKNGKDSVVGEVFHSLNLFEPLQSRWTFTSVLYELVDQVYKAELNHPLEKLALSLKSLVLNDMVADFDSKKKIKIPLEFFQFGFKLARLFDQYDFYRYDWLEKWESTSLSPTKWMGSVQKNWQEVVWKKVRMKHRELGSTLTRREELSVLANQINLTSRDAIPALPQKLSVFGISYLPFCYLDFLNQISKTIEIDYYQLDIVGQLSDSSSSSIFNYFFKMLADQSIDFFQKIHRLSPPIDFISNRHESLSRSSTKSVGILPLIRRLVHSPNIEELKNINKILLDLSTSSKNSSTNAPKWLDLQIHNCPSMLREVEVLKNNLWSVLHLSSEGTDLDTDWDIGLEDILVLAPNIEEYAPYINSVFASAPALGYHTTDHSLLSQSPLFKELELIFQLLGSQFEKSKLLEVLEGFLWQHHWQITPEKMEWVKQWLDQTNYHRGRKGEKSHQLFHLQASLNKIFIAYCTDSNLQVNSLASSEKAQNQESFFGELSIEKKKTFGRLLKAIRILSKYHQKVIKPQSLVSWVKLTKDLIEDCFLNLNHPNFSVIESKEKKEFLEKDALNLTEQLQKLVDEVSIHDFDVLIDSQTFRWILKESYVDTVSHGFLEGSITFASMMPMRAIPFKVIALLGMNDFPRSDRPMSFSLLREVRDGDRSKKKDDQLLFLETLMSATCLLHISYLGNASSDHSPLLPSSLLTNLVLSLSEQLILKSNPAVSASKAILSPQTLQDLLTLKHPLREIDRKVSVSKKVAKIKFLKPGFFYTNYSKSDFVSKQFKQTNNPAHWEILIKKYFSSKLTTDFKGRVESIKADISRLESRETDSSFANLKRALISPLNWFVRQQLHAATASNKAENHISDLEPFQLNPLSEYELVQIIKNQVIYRDTLNQLISAEQLERNEKVVSGIFSELSEIKFNKKMTPIFKVFLSLTKKLEGLTDVAEKASLTASAKDLKLPVVTSPHIISTYSTSGDIWAFDLNRQLVEVPLMFNGVQIGFRNLKQKISDVINLFLQHIVLSFLPEYKGAIMLNSPFKKEYQEEKPKNLYLLSFPKLNSVDASEMWQHYHDLFDLASCIPLPLLDNNTSLEIIELIENEKFDKINQVLSNRKFQKPSEQFNEQATKLEWILREHPYYVIEIYRAIFEPIRRHSKFTANKMDAIDSLNSFKSSD